VTVRERLLVIRTEAFRSLHLAERGPYGRITGCRALHEREGVGVSEFSKMTVMPLRETIEAPPAALTQPTAKLAELETMLSSALRGKPEAVSLSLVCLLARGHLLIEDVPGVGKTTLAQALARSVSCTFHRLQFTSDMLPSDVLGVTIYNAHSELFEFRRGPIFTNFLLADEINRTTPRTQSALLEAMNEQQVTIDGRSHPLPHPFMVIATQNPVEHHGTYPLPESQLDRFLMRLRIGYPGPESEREILRNSDGYFADAVQAALSVDEVIELQNMAQRVTVESSLVDYMLAIVARTRTHESLSLGVSPRGSQALFRASQAMALIEGRDYVVPHDIKRLAVPIFGHRVVVSTRASLAQRKSDLGERIIEEILQHVDVPL
jgi:MoxR-like ATPase